MSLVLENKLVSKLKLIQQLNATLLCYPWLFTSFALSPPNISFQKGKMAFSATAVWASCWASCAIPYASCWMCLQDYLCSTGASLWIVSWSSQAPRWALGFTGAASSQRVFAFGLQATSWVKHSPCPCNEARSYLFTTRPLKLMATGLSCTHLQGASVHFAWDAWGGMLGQGCCWPRIQWRLLRDLWCPLCTLSLCCHVVN